MCRSKMWYGPLSALHRTMKPCIAINEQTGASCIRFCSNTNAVSAVENVCGCKSLFFYLLTAQNPLSSQPHTYLKVVCPVRFLSVVVPTRAERKPRKEEC